jgi:hypothetical protein
VGTSSCGKVPASPGLLRGCDLCHFPMLPKMGHKEKVTQFFRSEIAAVYLHPTMQLDLFAATFVVSLFFDMLTMERLCLTVTNPALVGTLSNYQ